MPHADQPTSPVRHLPSHRRTRDAVVREVRSRGVGGYRPGQAPKRGAVPGASLGKSVRCPRRERSAVGVLRWASGKRMVTDRIVLRLHPTAPVMVEPVVVSFEDHAIRWIRAVGLVRELLGCKLLSLEEL
jgi:hypothetical protein